MSRLDQFIKATTHLQKYRFKGQACDVGVYYKLTNIKAFKHYLCNFKCQGCLLNPKLNPLDTTSLL